MTMNERKNRLMKKKIKFYGMCAGLVVVIVISLIILSPQSFRRSIKSFGSEFGGGLNRTVSVYSYDGELIRSWYGKFDVSDSENEVFFDVNGKRVIIHGGIVINEEN